MEQVKVLDFIAADRVLKHKQVTGDLKISSSKKRKYHQQLIRKVIEGVIDEQAQKAVNRDRASIARAARAAHFKAKYGNIEYASNGVDIVSVGA